MTRNEVSLPIGMGELLLRNGAEIFRVEQTIGLMAKALGADKTDSFVTLTGLFTSIEIDGSLYTFVRRVSNRSYDLAMVTELNDLSRRFCNGEISTISLETRMIELQKPRIVPRKRWSMALASGFGSLGFGIIIGLTTFSSLAYATLNGFLVSLILDLISSRFKVPESLAVLLSSTLLTALTFLYPGLSGTEQNLVNLGGLFLLLPGITLSTSIRELANGDLLSGISRLAEALITLTMIAAGVITCFTFLPLLQEVFQS